MFLKITLVEDEWGRVMMVGDKIRVEAWGPIWRLWQECRRVDGVLVVVETEKCGWI